MKAGDSNDTKGKQLPKDKRSANVLTDIDAKVFERWHSSCRYENPPLLDALESS